MSDKAPPIARSAFGKTRDGRAVEQFTIANRHGASLRFLSYGGIVTEINVPDRDGRIANVTLGLDSVGAYETHFGPYLGALIGRYGNRISGAKFNLEGKEYSLPANNGPNSLHGGGNGFEKAIWDVEFIGTNAAKLTLVSPDGDEGYPGTLKVAVTYTFGDDNTWRIDYEATTDKPTVLNLTHHAYFNLAGQSAGSIEGHLLTLAADAFVETTGAGIPTGKLMPVDGTPFDFRRATPIGARIRLAHPQIVAGRGYDHNFVINRSGTGLLPFARVYDPASGRSLEMATTEPGVQFYSGNYLDGTIPTPDRRVYRQGDGFCLETQHYPDSPNRPEFPSVVLRPGETFRSSTTHAFSTDAG